jgi:hypothetical protein
MYEDEGKFSMLRMENFPSSRILKDPSQIILMYPIAVQLKKWRVMNGSFSQALITRHLDYFQSDGFDR